MCGIIISDLVIPEDYKFIKNRGPDYTNTVTYNNYMFIHFLLHLTGDKTYQPIIDNNVAYIFNGEIYNYKELNTESKSDIYSIIKTYNSYGEKFFKYLDGEFVIVIFDFNENKIFIVSDLFKTKPLFFNINKNIVISSYESECIKIKNQQYFEINPNEALIFDLNTKKMIKKEPFYIFNLQQIKESYDDYCIMLEKAILKRYPEKTIPLIPLSSGHDSGAIVCCLQKYNKPFIAISINKNEDNEVMKQRKELLKEKLILIDLQSHEKTYWNNYLNNFCEPFIWDWTYHPKMSDYRPNGFTMGSMLGKSKIFNFIKKKNPAINICYSGIGADEVMALNSFYSQGYGNVDIFPKQLESVFPWPNFYNGSMKNYLKGDEYIGGTFSFETRYPFCDKDLVQEFLYLTSELKNSFNGNNYKPAISYYLQKENFPYQCNKYGFNV